ncbi:MAG TPA: CHASE domain-containing protein [Anaeromyxobacteraceae bacterium]|jgi:signal transduction histidine kinase|nr:CHASE domain-containing protein [Anaeromyxobacteraceae bacterium]
MNQSSHSLRGALRRDAAAWALLLASLVVTALASRSVARAVRAEQRARFDEVAVSAEGEVRARLEAYLALLRGARGIFPGGREPSPAAFSELVRSLELDRHYPGIQGIGYARRLAPSELAAEEARRREEGHPEYRVWPEGPRDVYSAIVWLEPLDWRNRRAIGYDMLSEPIRRAAMERARDTGIPAATARVVLVQEAGEDVQAGFLIYLPIYRGATRTVAERRAALAGWVYAPFRADDLMRGILGAGGPRGLDVELFDGERVDRAALLFDQHRTSTAASRSGLARLTRLEVAGRIWTARFLPADGAAPVVSQRFLGRSVAIAGAVFSLLVFWIVRSLGHGRAAAEEAERRQAALAEENARLLRRAEEAVRARDDFLSLASHELKTPLTALRLQAHALARNAAALAPEALPSRAEGIRRSTDRMARLVETLLDLSRINAGGLSIEPVEADLSRVVHEVAERFADEAHRAGCQLVVLAPDVLGGRWDPLRLDHVVTNLVANAIKYGPGKPVEVLLEEEGDRARLVVRDRGIGIAPVDQRRIFGRFERAVAGTAFGGFGLGLWIARQTVEAHGGTISVESAAGQGATFTVVLPRSAPVQTAADGPARA